MPKASLSIGIDLVVRPKEVRSAWLDKVLCPSEIRWVPKGSSARRTLWLMWAAKEAAFKASYPLYPNQPFHPKAFEILTLGLTESTIRHLPSQQVFVVWHPPPQQLGLRSLPSTSLVAIALSRPEDKEQLTLKDIQFEEKAIESGGLYTDFQAFLASHLQVPLDELTLIPRRRRQPMITLKGQEQSISFSMTHDGPFGIWAFLTES